MAKVLPSRKDNMGLVDVKIITSSEKWNMLERLFREYLIDRGITYNKNLIDFIEWIINKDDIEERLRKTFGLEKDED